jgi:hypothetical protein
MYISYKTNRHCAKGSFLNLESEEKQAVYLQGVEQLLTNNLEVYMKRQLINITAVASLISLPFAFAQAANTQASGTLTAKTSNP